MTEWREITLGDVCELKRGYDLPQRAREFGEVPIVSSSGVSGYHSTPKVKGPGVVTGRYGTLGQVFLVDEDFWPLNTALYVRDFKGNDPEFVAGLLRLMDLGQYDGAAAVPGLNRNQLHMIPVKVPPPTIQRKISQFTRTMDDLIGNNRRRVELLEEMARAIYREWFVHFRFPGHEDVAFVDSDLGPIPQGWRSVRSGELMAQGVLDIGDGYRAKNAEMVDGHQGLPFLRVANVQEGYLDLTQVDRLPMGYLGRLKSKVARPRDTVLCMKGTVGRMARVPAEAPPMAYSPQVSWWRSLDEGVLPPAFLHEWLRSDAFVRQCAAVKGATDMADYVNLKDQRRMKLVVPDERAAKDFASVADPLHRLADELQANAGCLANLRDLLLPKLVTGQIDVSDLDLAAVETASRGFAVLGAGQ